MNEEEFEKYTCPCCLLPANVQALSFAEASLDRIGQISLRSKEYFQVLMFFALVLAVLFVTSSVHQLVVNPPIASCVLSLCSGQSGQLKTFYSQLGSTGSSEIVGLDVTLSLALLIIFTLKYLFLCFLIKQNSAHNRRSPSVAKYSIHANNLHSMSIEEIKSEIVFAYQKRNKSKIHVDNIVEVSRAQNMADHFFLVSKLIDSVKRLKIAKIKNRGSLEPLQTKIKNLRQRLLKLKDSQTLNQALVIFDREDIARGLLTNKWERLFKKYFGGQLYFSQAMEPEDVLWENFGDSEQKRLVKILFSYVAAGLIMLGRF